MLNFLFIFTTLKPGYTGVYVAKMFMLEIKKSAMAAITGGTSTTLKVVIGYANTVSENEYWDCDGDGKLSEGDTFIGIEEVEIPC
ncbi:MAG: hypothetical protein FWH23_02590 [Bacteroidales bacterium]|nr:hypothetical protein [Bacteroidales bacterium]